MHDITVIENQITEMKKREAFIKTPEGKLQAEAEILKIFGALNGYGYKLPDGDERSLAKLWVGALEDYIVLYGFGVIKKAVMTFVQNDTKGFCPKVGDIIAEAKKSGKNPRAEMAKLKAQQEEEALIKKWKEEKEKERNERNWKNDDI